MQLYYYQILFETENMFFVHLIAQICHGNFLTVNRLNIICDYCLILKAFTENLNILQNSNQKGNYWIKEIAELWRYIPKR